MRPSITQFFLLCYGLQLNVSMDAYEGEGCHLRSLGFVERLQRTNSEYEYSLGTG